MDFAREQESQEVKEGRLDRQRLRTNHLTPRQRWVPLLVRIKWSHICGSLLKFYSLPSVYSVISKLFLFDAVIKSLIESLINCQTAERILKEMNVEIRHLALNCIKSRLHLSHNNKIT